jgi:hypothetical protein
MTQELTRFEITFQKRPALFGGGAMDNHWQMTLVVDGEQLEYRTAYPNEVGLFETQVEHFTAAAVSAIHDALKEKAEAGVDA